MNTEKLKILGELLFCSTLAICMFITALIAFINLIEMETKCGTQSSTDGQATSQYYSEPLIFDEESLPK